MTSEPEPLTPGVYDAAYRLGWALARAGQLLSINNGVHDGIAAYSEQAEAERIERIQAEE